MKLKCLELQGFKTFPNKTTVEFVDGISVVVGPNGSGKSNISDAMRWVLGEQSVKNLRCSKLEDVIFAGSSSKKAQGFAGIKLTFDNSDHCLKDFEDEVSIMRRYYRSGESDYFINMKPSRLKDINELFMDTGVGKDGYSIIGQGKIDSIISAKSSERREIFEEAAGISGCRYRKEDAESKLDLANENLTRIKDILSELEARVEPLRKQSETAKLYMKYSERKKMLEISLWVNEVDLSKIRIIEHKEKLDIIRGQKKEIDEILTKLEEKIENSTYKSNFCITKIDEARHDISCIDKEISGNHSQVLVLENRIDNNKEMVKKFRIEISENQRKIDVLDKEINNKLKLLDNKNLDIQKKRSYLNDMVQDLEKIKDKFSGCEDKGFDLENELKLFENRRNQINVEKLLLESTLKESSSRYKVITSSISYKMDELEKIEEKLNNKKENINIVSNNLDCLNKEIEDINNSRAEKIREYNKIKDLSQRLTLDSDSELRKIRLLEELERNMEGFSHSVKAIIKKSKAGKIHGIIGTVSNILKVPSKFAVSIDISLGVAIQNIITETEESAKLAINFLKKGKLGRATFLPITSIKGNRAELNNIKGAPGFIGIAGDLCEFESKYTNIVNYILGRVIIADNIDNAVIIAKKFMNKFKVVTLDGQVINPGGSLTGGSVSNKIGLVSRLSEIAELRRNYEKVSKEAIKSREEVEKLKECIKEGDLVSKDKNNQIEKIKAEKNLLISDISVINSEKRANEISVKELSRELEMHNKRKAKLLDEIHKYDEEILQLDEKIEELKLSLSNAQKINSEFAKESEEKNLKIQQIKTELMCMQNEVDVLNVEIVSLKSKKEENLQKIKNLSFDIKNMDINNVDIQNKIVMLNAAINNFEKRKKNLCIEIDTMKLKREDLEKLSVTLRKEEKDKSHENEILVKEMSRLEERGVNIQKEYDVIIAKLWDEYNLTLGEAKECAANIEDVNRAKKELAVLKTKIKSLGEVNVSAIDEYKEVSERYLSMKDQVDDIEHSKRELLNIINSLNKDMKIMFVNKFNEINKNFSFIVNELFGGGGGKLILEDNENVLSCGINISVQVPGKKEIHLEALSGGEKALIAISLYFAIIKVNPPPFCVLDEIEAALDDVNVDRFAKYLRKICEKTQFIVITHRRGTMEEADALYGVTMEEEGISKLLELRVNEIANKNAM